MIKQQQGQNKEDRNCNSKNLFRLKQLKQIWIELRRRRYPFAVVCFAEASSIALLTTTAEIDGEEALSTSNSTARLKSTESTHRTTCGRAPKHHHSPEEAANVVGEANKKKKNVQRLKIQYEAIKINKLFFKKKIKNKP